MRSTCPWAASTGARTVTATPASGPGGPRVARAPHARADSVARPWRLASRPSLLSPERALLLLLVFIPVAAAAEWLGWGGVATFACAALAIVPLAGLMGAATERIADRLGAGVGGLLNATFGNAAELIIALVALSRGYHDVVKASLTGSIIGNILLVLGLAIVAGGARREKQSFDRTSAAT